MIPSTRVFADPDVELEFRKSGYGVLPVLDQSEIGSLQELWDRLAIAVPSDYFASACGDDPRIRRLAQDGILEVLAPHVSSITPDYRPVCGSFAVKRGNGSNGKVALHQDCTLVDQSIFTAVHMWCPLVDVDEHNGCLWVVAGSHAFFDHISGLSGNPNPWDGVVEILCSECSTPVPLKAGTAIFFNGRTLHWSAENQSDRTRVAAGFISLPANSNIRFHMWDPANPNRFEIMELEGQMNVQLGSRDTFKRPYPEDWRPVGFMDYQCQPVTPSQIEPLKVRRPGAVTAALPKRRGWLAQFLHR
jgi:hypothetical protein